MTPRNGSLAFGSGHRLPTSGRINHGAGNPVWSENPIADTSFNLNYDLAPDGKGIVALMPAAENKGAQEARVPLFRPVLCAAARPRSFQGTPRCVAGGSAPLMAELAS